MCKSNMNLKEIALEQARPLSNDEVMALVKNKAKVVLYEDLIDYESIEDLLHPYGAVFLLYQQAPTFGHWVALIKRKDEIEFFDPLAYFIDAQLAWTKPKMRAQLNMDYPYLTRLLLDAPRKYALIYNEHKFQKNKPGTATCGRWAATRIAMKDYSLTEFVEMFDLKKGLNDELVTALTMD